MYTELYIYTYKVSYTTSTVRGGSVIKRERERESGNIFLILKIRCAFFDKFRLSTPTGGTLHIYVRMKI